MRKWCAPGVTYSQIKTTPLLDRSAHTRALVFKGEECLVEALQATLRFCTRTCDGYMPQLVGSKIMIWLGKANKAIPRSKVLLTRICCEQADARSEHWCLPDGNFFLYMTISEIGGSIKAAEFGGAEGRSSWVERTHIPNTCAASWAKKVTVRWGFLKEKGRITSPSLYHVSRLPQSNPDRISPRTIQVEKIFQISWLRWGRVGHTLQETIWLVDVGLTKL